MSSHVESLGSAERTWHPGILEPAEESIGTDEPSPAIEMIRSAAMRPVLSRPRWFWPVVGMLSAVLAVGFAAWVVQLRTGLGSAGYSDQAFWAIYEANLVTFIGVSYGGAVVSAILRITKTTWRAPLTRIAEATALVTLPIGMLFIVPHLGSSWKLWELIWPPYWNLSSPILWDFFAVSTYLLATCAFFYLPLISDLAIGAERLALVMSSRRRRLVHRAYRLLAGSYDGSLSQRRLLAGAIGLVAIMVIPMAVSVHSVLSFAFASSSRPGYLETIFPVYFVVAALYSGVALVIVVVAAARRLFHLEAFIERRHLVRLGFIMVALGAAYLYLTFTEYLIDSYSNTTGNAAWVYETILGRYWMPFWFYFVAGGVVPILVFMFRRTRTATGVVTAAALVLAAMWVKRLVIVIPPATEPLVRSPFGPTGALGLGWGTYHFTWVSISITVAMAAAIALLLLIVFRLVPILPIAEMEELAAAAQRGAVSSAVAASGPAAPLRAGNGAPVSTGAHAMSPGVDGDE
ncbi:MAG: polysulfide reductase NrfD [Actinomycetota bacterium]|nr:polysulfide reductase NrfD [Actinomycetota bacterium]MDA8357265.1 polysulfide reductase NrfD [Actinomycetota bacterium]